MSENDQSGKQICVDVNLTGADGDKFEKILSRVAVRTARRGKVSKPIGGEVSFLKNAAKRRINGDILGVDGLLEKGINVSANVSNQEVERITNDPNFKINAELDTYKK